MAVYTGKRNEVRATRLLEEEANALDTIARLRGLSVSDVLRILTVREIAKAPECASPACSPT